MTYSPLVSSWLKPVPFLLSFFSGLPLFDLKRFATVSTTPPTSPRLLLIPPPPPHTPLVLLVLVLLLRLLLRFFLQCQIVGSGCQYTQLLSCRMISSFLFWFFCDVRPSYWSKGQLDFTSIDWIPWQLIDECPNSLVSSSGRRLMSGPMHLASLPSIWLAMAELALISWLQSCEGSNWIRQCCIDWIRRAAITLLLAWYCCGDYGNTPADLLTKLQSSCGPPDSSQSNQLDETVMQLTMIIGGRKGGSEGSGGRGGGGLLTSWPNIVDQSGEVMPQKRFLRRWWRCRPPMEYLSSINQ